MSGPPDVGAILAVVGMTREARIVAATPVVVGAGALARRLEGDLSGGLAGVVSFGLCGALDPALEIGDVLVGEAVSAGAEVIAADAEWSRRLLGALAGALPARFAGAERPIASVPEKAELRRRTGAAAVDMESASVARLARRSGTPFAVLRAVSDTARRPLPSAARVGLGPDGRPAMGAVLASLAARPWQVGALIRTALEAEAALRALERARHLLGPRLGGPDLG
ncbi:MAG TPA: hypothetical protein VMU93_05075 [Caulobacteraceae bacterium]|nr:hypothetical protein [Caulobacteraceae bacterium]